MQITKQEAEYILSLTTFGEILKEGGFKVEIVDPDTVQTNSRQPFNHPHDFLGGNFWAEIIEACPSHHKIAMIKLIHFVTTMSLSDAKCFVEQYMK